ncbi:unnamed protein product [Effrenium voratum]|uniref:mannosyl-oligosaccharide 1,2-alpha-mannosidase n=1 Tax=Effrenium voratum TaxID=2562239 RepID=A0AA36IEI7_9DINO|nr:unnamed protein product [Effrenium voratum]
MDHLTCFLPGALGLDVFHHSLEVLGGVSVQPHLLSKDRAVELTLAHRLTQSCVHMYFRTGSDLAPEITRFSSQGLRDDHGSMHNILRPETVESLYVMWRSTKLQIYRNWGQRLLSAFYRQKTTFGFAGLHNVNTPSSKRDDMPSFFMAETLKYFFLLFSADSVLPLDHFVLSTEAHPLPMLRTLAALGAKPWPCDSNATSLPPERPSKPAATPQRVPREVQSGPSEELVAALQVLGQLMEGPKVPAPRADERPGFWLRRVWSDAGETGETGSPVAFLTKLQEAGLSPPLRKVFGRATGPSLGGGQAMATGRRLQRTGRGETGTSQEAETVFLDLQLCFNVSVELTALERFGFRSAVFGLFVEDVEPLRAGRFNLPNARIACCNELRVRIAYFKPLEGRPW